MMQDYEWREVNRDLWEKTYESEAGHLLYVLDEYKNDGLNQTEIEDWHKERYSVFIREPFKPNTEEKKLFETDSQTEAEVYMDYHIGDMDSWEISYFEDLFLE